MFDNILKIFKKFAKEEKKDTKTVAKERLHLVLMQDRANVSADFMELMKQEIIEVIKKYIDVDENSIDVKLTNKVNSDGTTGAPILYANIPILNVKDDTKQINVERDSKQELDNQEVKEEQTDKKEKYAEDLKRNKESEKIENKENTKKQETQKLEEQKKQNDGIVDSNKEIAKNFKERITKKD